MTLPRMSFEFIGVQYDASRKTTQTQQFFVEDPAAGSKIKKDTCLSLIICQLN